MAHDHHHGDRNAFYMEQLSTIAACRLLVTLPLPLWYGDVLKFLLAPKVPHLGDPSAPTVDGLWSPHQRHRRLVLRSNRRQGRSGHTATIHDHDPPP